MMPYEILNFVIPDTKYRRKRFTFQCRNFDLEIDLSRLHNYSYIYRYIYSKFIVNGNVWSVAMLESKEILWDLNAVVMTTISVVPLNLHAHRQRVWTALYSGCVGHDKTQTADHADCADRAGCVTFMFPFFLNCYLYMIKVCTPFSYLFGNIGTVSSFWKLHGKILCGSFCNLCGPWL